MKVIQINTVCGTGSIGRIMVDLYHEIKKTGNESVLAYGRGEASSDLLTYKIGNRGDFYRHVLRNFFLDGSGFGSRKQTKDLVAWLKEERPDVIHLHNIHGFYLQIEELFAYLKESEVPVVWTLHDCWSYTGHCAYYDYHECEGWHTGCKKCRWHANTYPYAIFRDNAASNFKRKRQAFCGLANVTLVTPSEWLKREVEQSFLKVYPIEVIPNGINLNLFSLKSKTQQKEKFILLGVANIWEKRKGLEQLLSLGERLPKNYELWIVGVSESQKKRIEKKQKQNNVKLYTRTKNPSDLASLYRQADVYINTTLEDNFPTTNLEALSCGTPVVTFQTGGSAEAITKECGFVVPKGDIEEMLAKIYQICETKCFRPELCRMRAMQYDKNERFKSYIKLYQKLQKKKEEA